MKQLLPLVAILTIFFSYCNIKTVDNFEFGIKYNRVRQKFGSPLINSEMNAHNCCGEGTIYQINKVPFEHTAYHSSKTIRAITNGKPTEEKDIYRKNLNDTTIYQLNVLTALFWEKDSADIHGSVFKVDKRTLQLNPKGLLNESSKYPNYGVMRLNLKQIDSVLTAWGLSRFDQE